MRRRHHHLPDAVFFDVACVVSLTLCTAGRARWGERPELAHIACAEVAELDRSVAPVVGYCLMPDHLHVLFVAGGVLPTRFMQLLKGRVSRRLRAIDPGFEVWQRGYYDHVVRRSEGLLAALRYVLMNPVRAGLVEVDRWWSYPWLGAPAVGAVGAGFFDGEVGESGLWEHVVTMLPRRGRGGERAG